VGFQDLLLSATCTDDSGNGYCPLRLYLNGTEAKTRIEAVTGQGNETRYFDLTPFLSLLVPGTNTIGVTLSNVWSTWDDIAFDLRLQAIPAHSLNPRLHLAWANPVAPALSYEAAPGTIWQLQSTDNLLPAHWQTVQTITNLPGLPATILDTGQNGRLLPTTTKNRFYRLVPW
jgi:hypothetical protein